MIYVNKEIENMRDELTKIRRYFHSYPELSFEEYETSEFIACFLEKLGIEVQRNVAKTGVVGFLRCDGAQKTYAFRADMDALPIDEETGVEFASRKKGVMHACGHDGHMAILLGLAKFLSENSEKLQANVLFIFQPAEEGAGGAFPMIKEGILKKYNVDSIFGLHIFPEIEEGRVGARPGVMMAQTGEIDIKIKGKSGHGAMPHKTIDSIVAASHFISALQSIISRNVDPFDSAVITIGRISGGEKRNIIAEEVILEGILRAFKEEVFQLLKSRIRDIMVGTERVFGVRISIDERDLYPAVYNDEDLFPVLVASVGNENIEIINPLMISEDFSYYQKEVPGIFFMLGCKNEKKGYVHTLHSNKFNFDERVLLIGVQVFVNILVNLKAFKWT